MREKNVTALLRWVLEILYREMGLLRGTVTLRRGDQLFIEASHGLSDAEIRRGKYRLGEGITGQVALSGIPRVIPDISREPEFLDRTGARGRDSHVAFICVPIIHRDEVIGTLSIDREMTPGADLDRDFNLLEIVANLMADAVSLDLSEHDERARLRAENARLKQELDQVTGPPELIGRCQAMRRVYTMIAQVASSSATVLIRGASGTGKELVARAVQRAGDRRDKPFVVVNSAALPENLIESELFGHEKAHSPAPPAAGSAGWKPPIPERSFSMKSATSAWRCRSNFCASSRSEPSSGSAATRSMSPTSGSSRRPAATWNS